MQLLREKALTQFLIFNAALINKYGNAVPAQ